MSHAHVYSLVALAATEPAVGHKSLNPVPVPRGHDATLELAAKGSLIRILVSDGMALESLLHTSPFYQTPRPNCHGG